MDDRTAQEHLTPEARRGLLRAFADRMLLKITAMDDPEDMPGVERCVRVAAVIERLYSRCDRAERHAPDPFQQQAERARQESEAIKARVSLANTLEWGEKRRRDLGPWWDAAATAAQVQAPAQALSPKPNRQAPRATLGLKQKTRNRREGDLNRAERTSTRSYNAHSQLSYAISKNRNRAPSGRDSAPMTGTAST